MAHVHERRFGPLRITLVQGDIVRQPDADAIVNAANARLLTGGGVAGAIHRAAGPGLEEESAPLGPIRPGEAVITGGHDLPNRHVIHVLGPVYGRNEPADELLAEGHRAALCLAEEHGLGRVAFPAISTGAFGYPIEQAATVALRAVARQAGELRSVREVRFVLHAEDDFDVFARALAELDPDAPDPPRPGTLDPDLT